MSPDATDRPATTTPTESAPVKPSPGAVGFFGALVVISVGLAAAFDKGDGFVPRVETVDAFAGLAIGAFLVDRLINFVPPYPVADDPIQRAADLKVLRLGYGALLGMFFVLLTDLRAVEVLSGQGGDTVSPEVDRGITVLVIAGGVAGLSRVLSGLNPQPETQGDKDSEKSVVAGETTVPPPGWRARTIGVALVVVGALVALFALDDKNGVELLGDEEDDSGAVAVVVRFGLVLLAAAIVEQIAELVGRWRAVPKHKKVVILGGLSVALGVVAARVLDLYFLHNIGFFNPSSQELNDALPESSKLERWGDTFLTGVLIGAGTKALHDLASRLRKVKEDAAPTA